MEARGLRAPHPQLAKGGVNRGSNPSENFEPRRNRRKHTQYLRPFSPSWLDEFDLTPSEFRVVTHLWRRADREGWSFPSVSSIAKHCRLNEDTVWRALRSLEARALVARRNVPGRSNHFRVCLPRDAGLNPAESEGLGAPESEGLHPPETEGDRAPESGGREGIPPKAIQIAAQRSNLDGEPRDSRGLQKSGRKRQTSGPSQSSNAGPPKSDAEILAEYAALAERGRRAAA
jgi:hypothetical protein